MSNETSPYHSNYERNVAMGATTVGVMTNVIVGVGIAAAGLTLFSAIVAGIGFSIGIGIGVDLVKQTLLGR